MSENLHSRVVVLTGGVATGKSTVARHFAARGALVVDADEVAREAVAPGSAGLERVRQTFGDAFIRPDGTLDRSALGRRVFSDPAERRKLESILHPIIRDLADAKLRRALAQGPPLVVYDCPLFFEAGLDRLGFGKVIVVTAPADSAVERLVARNGLSAEEAGQRVAAQLDIGEKARRADIVIANDGTREALEERAASVFADLTGKAS